jgi:hypothetical protein
MACFIQSQYVEAVSVFLLIPILASYVMDVRGLEIDKQKNQIRNYQSFLFFRFGQWSSLNHLFEIHITQSVLSIRRVTNASGTYSGYRSHDSYPYYATVLTDSKRKIEIILNEHDRYHLALKFATKFAKAAELYFPETYLRHRK